MGSAPNPTVWFCVIHVKKFCPDWEKVLCAICWTDPTLERGRKMHTENCTRKRWNATCKSQRKQKMEDRSNLCKPCVSLVLFLVCNTRCCYPRCQPGSFPWTGRSLWLVITLNCSEQRPEPHPSKKKKIVPTALFLLINNKNKTLLNPAVRRWTRLCAKRREARSTLNETRTTSSCHSVLGPAWLGQN